MVTSLLASIERLGWCMPSATEMVDDLGISWNLTSVSPGAVAAACRDTVRRWRLLRIGRALPGLIPDKCDVGDPNQPHSVLVDLYFAAQPFLRGTGIGSRPADDWKPIWRHSLLSAACGGQWPQARKASVPQFGITDPLCQLCHEHLGTIEHRFECP